VNFVGYNRLQKLFHANFSVSANDHFANGTPTKLKIPALIFRSELEMFLIPDVRVGGFGPWYGLSLVISLVIAGLLVVRKQFAHVAIIAMLLLSAVLHPESWWARYAPQLWLIPLVSVTCAFHRLKASAPVTGLNYLLLAVLAVNVILVANTNMRFNNLATLQTRQLLSVEKAAASKALPEMVEFGNYRAYRVRYHESGMNYVETKMEYDLFRNHLLPLLTGSERQLFQRCYAVIGTPNGRDPNDFYANGQFLLLHNMVSSDDMRLLAAVYARIAENPALQKRRLFL
jgi:hypothetical protein